MAVKMVSGELHFAGSRRTPEEDARFRELILERARLIQEEGALRDRLDAIAKWFRRNEPIIAELAGK